MLQKERLTVSDKLLMAAFVLDGGQEKSFTAEDLVVIAWQKFPATFGLRGHNNENGLPKYPDSNRVFAEIMGSKPIRKRGYLLKVGKKTYGLTVSGRDLACKLSSKRDSMESGRSDLPSQGKASISREVLTWLKRVLSSRAVQRAQNGETNRITFHDACLFWGINPRTTSIELEGNFKNLEVLIDQVRQVIEGGASELQTGRNDLPVSTPQILRKLHLELQSKFSEELNTIRERKDQRKR